jgi:hypothetical protein
LFKALDKTTSLNISPDVCNHQVQVAMNISRISNVKVLVQFIVKPLIFGGRRTPKILSLPVQGTQHAGLGVIPSGFLH